MSAENKKPENPSAFPGWYETPGIEYGTDGVTRVTGAPQPHFTPGMTLRDYFAGQAMQAILTKHTLYRLEKDSGLYSLRLAAMSYEIAAAMLAERSKQS